MERFVRSAGHELEAGEVYYSMREFEAKRANAEFMSALRRWRHWREIAHKASLAIWESIQWKVWRFGVRPLRLILFTALLIEAGWCVFEIPDAVIVKEGAA